MIDIKLIRESLKEVKKNLALRNDKFYLEKLNEVISKDSEWRKLKQEADTLRHKRNQVSNEINNAKKQGKGTESLIKEAREIPKKLQDVENKEREFLGEIHKLLFEIPNLLDKKVPKGKDEKDNKVIKKWGKAEKKKVLSHEEIGEKLDILDLKTATKLTGEGFYILKGELAQLERALINFMLDFHKKKGRIEIYSPILVNPKTAEGTAHLPKFDADMYKTREGFYLIPTAEMTLTNLHRGEILNEKDLPKKYCGYTPCFRTEAGQHGSETPGIYRVHQFDKVEMVSICTPKQAEKELKLMLSDAEELVKKLKISYRVIILCSGDAGFKEALTYDIETWSPFLKKYMETSSVSTCTDFQARRMNTRFQSKEGLKFVHTLNGSGLALPRLIIAILENYQQKDGSIKIPKVLQSYLGGKKFIGRKSKRSKN